AANAGLVAFGKSSGKTITSRHKFVSADKEGIKRIMHEMVASGNTPLVRSMGMGFEMLQEQAQRQGGYGEYHMVIVTDGEASDGNPANMARKIVLSSPVIINAIGFCLNGKHSLDVDGYTKFSVANDPAALSAGLKGVLAESESFDTDTFVVQ
ncbi:MAG: hypothetical protein OEZ04_12435, partial [Nitrospinota bacterium]|nr:hypothetical protein [Nitrospinota bacterium]